MALTIHTSGWRYDPRTALCDRSRKSGDAGSDGATPAVRRSRRGRNDPRDDGGRGDARHDELALLARHMAEMRRELERLRADLAHERDLHHLAQQEVRALKRSWSYRIGRIVVAPASAVKLST